MSCRSASSNMVLEIGIEDVEVLSKRAGNVPVGSVVIHLKREIGALGESM